MSKRSRVVASLFRVEYLLKFAKIEDYLNNKLERLNKTVKQSDVIYFALDCAEKFIDSQDRA